MAKKGKHRDYLGNKYSKIPLEIQVFKESLPSIIAEALDKNAPILYSPEYKFQTNWVEWLMVRDSLINLIKERNGKLPEMKLEPSDIPKMGESGKFGKWLDLREDIGILKNTALKVASLEEAREIEDKIAEFRDVFIKSRKDKIRHLSQSLEEETKKYKSAEEFIASKTPIYRYGEPRAKPVSGSTFYTPHIKVAEDYNLSGTAKRMEAFVDESNLYKGESSVQYAIDNNLMDKPMSENLQKLTGLKTLREVDDEYSMGVTEKASKEYQQNPNIFYTVFQQTVARDLKSKGFSGARWSYEDDLSPTQYQIWDDFIVKTREQLIEIYNKTKLK